MRQLTFIKKGLVEWHDVPEPRLAAPVQAIVRPFVAARCDGDCLPLFRSVTSLVNAGIALHFLDPLVTEVLGPAPFRGPFAFGHECIATVLAVGEDVRTVAVGDQVIVPWAISCGSCFPCKNGLTAKCTQSGNTMFSAYGFGSAMGGWGGAVSDQLLVPFADAMLLPVPKGLERISIASASDNIPDGFRTVAPHLRRWPGAPVLIVGGAARSIGLYAAGVAVAMGSSQVDYMDHQLERLEIAESLGANPIELPKATRRLAKNVLAKGGCYLISVDASASADGIRLALRSLAPGGCCTGVGYYFFKSAKLPLAQMYFNSTTLHLGVSNPRSDLPDLLALIASRRFQPEKVTTMVASWEDAPKAFLEDTTKVVVQRSVEETRMLEDPENRL
jgi:threonine dehydrogenase-like Zn-dependent dehydrogenase